MLALDLRGLGQDAAPPLVDPLKHSLVPFRRRARYLRLVGTKSQALNYAAGGFHVSVTRGLAGGCADPSANFADGGTKTGACVAPLGRGDLRSKWSNAAQAYLQAFNSAQQGALVEQVKQLLRTANGLASQAYAAEGVPPPRDPVTQETEPVSPGRGISGVGLAIGLAGLMGLTAYAIHRGQTAYEGGIWV